MKGEFAERLRAGEPLVGTVVTVCDPVLAELVGGSFDFAWIDLEHAALDIGDVPGLVVGLRASGAAALVRLPRWDTERLSPVLDAGVDGVVAPRIQSAVEAEALVRSLRYPPEGIRGFGPRRAGDYGRGRPNARPLCLVQVETGAACLAAEAIAAVDGIDAIVVGTADLGFDLGCPHDTGDPRLRDAVEVARVGTGRGGAVFGIAAGDPGVIAELGAPSGSLGVVAVDVRIFASAVEAAARAMADAFTTSRQLTPLQS